MLQFLRELHKIGHITKVIESERFRQLLLWLTLLSFHWSNGYFSENDTPLLIKCNLFKPEVKTHRLNEIIVNETYNSLPRWRRCCWILFQSGKKTENTCFIWRRRRDTNLSSMCNHCIWCRSWHFHFGQLRWEKSMIFKIHLNRTGLNSPSETLMLSWSISPVTRAPTRGGVWPSLWRTSSLAVNRQIVV